MLEDKEKSKEIEEKDKKIENENDKVLHNSEGDTDITDENPKNMQNKDKKEKGESKKPNAAPNGGKKKTGWLLYLAVILLGLSMLFYVLARNGTIEPTLSYNQFKADVENDMIDEIVVTPSSVIYDVFYKEEYSQETEYYDEKLEKMVDYDIIDGRRHETVLNPNDDDFLKEIAQNGVAINVKSTAATSLISMFVAFLPTVILIGFMVWFMKVQFKGGLNEPKRIVKKSDVRFSDIAGMAEEKEELLFAIKSLQNVEEYVKKGVKPVKGILLEGPPGVGKTMLAKAVAGEAGVNFFSYSGSDFVEMFVGLGARRVRTMFEQAELAKPCVIFIDEIDALGRKRIAGGNGGTQEADQTLVALLERMDGLTSTSGILFIAATNRVDALDSALLRPGRFDKTIHINPPRTKEDRIDMVKVHSRDKTFAEGVTAELVAKQMFGMTGAEIASALNDAVLESFKDNRNGIISLDDIDKAIMKLYAKGLAKGRHSQKDLHRVAIHEVGHALMNRHLGRSVVKISVQPYSSGVGGVTQVDGESSGFDGLRTKTDIINDIKVCYGGKAAEETLCGECSIGASNDLEKATYLLRDYIGTYAMSSDNLLSLVGLARDNMMIGANEQLLTQMNEKALEIYKEVKGYFEDSEVQDILLKLADYLAENEVIYDMDSVMADYGYAFNSETNELEIVEVTKLSAENEVAVMNEESTEESSVEENSMDKNFVDENPNTIVSEENEVITEECSGVNEGSAAEISDVTVPIDSPLSSELELVSETIPEDEKQHTEIFEVQSTEDSSTIEVLPENEVSNEILLKDSDSSEIKKENTFRPNRIIKNPSAKKIGKAIKKLETQSSKPIKKK